MQLNIDIQRILLCTAALQGIEDFLLCRRKIPYFHQETRTCRSDCTRILRKRRCFPTLILWKCLQLFCTREFVHRLRTLSSRSTQKPQPPVKVWKQRKRLTCPACSRDLLCCCTLLLRHTAQQEMIEMTLCASCLYLFLQSSMGISKCRSIFSEAKEYIRKIAGISWAHPTVRDLLLKKRKISQMFLTNTP